MPIGNVAAASCEEFAWMVWFAVSKMNEILLAIEGLA